jgi:hypothetical protein
MKPGRLMAAVLAALLIPACASNSMSVADREAAKTRLAKAEAMLQERCKKAGVFIHRTAENVEGILLLKFGKKPISTINTKWTIRMVKIHRGSTISKVFFLNQSYMSINF